MEWVLDIGHDRRIVQTMDYYSRGGRGGRRPHVIPQMTINRGKKIKETLRQRCWDITPGSLHDLLPSKISHSQHTDTPRHSQTHT